MLSQSFSQVAHLIFIVDVYRRLSVIIRFCKIVAVVRFFNDNFDSDQVISLVYIHTYMYL